jgi:hypothetical protein
VKFDIQSYSRRSVPTTQEFPAALNCAYASTGAETTIYAIIKSEGDKQDQTFSIQGVQTAIAVQTSIARVEGDNGA